MMKRLVPVFVILLVVLGGCEEKYEAPADQPVFFEYRYVNHAWGYSEHGYIIDSDGDVRRFVHACYLYDSHKDKYQYILLNNSGDWQQSNDAHEAETLVKWLKGLDVFHLLSRKYPEYQFNRYFFHFYFIFP